ncbi:MAG: hypothetical protein KGN34_07255 [Sphingomonadales bacterium]|nr:hypothetical protein [Sphingomonadales bacterium]
MTTIIRRTPRKRRGPVLAMVLAILGAVLAVLGGVAALAWHRSGPQPIRLVAVALPDPVPAPELPR